MVVGAGEGQSLASLGRPRAILCCNVMLLSPIACCWYGSVRYSGYCHRLSTYYCLAPVLAENKRASSRTIRWKERALSRSRQGYLMFHPDGVHGLQVKVHPGARACGFRFHHERTNVRMDTTNCKYRLVKCRALWGEPERRRAVADVKW